MLNSKCTHPQPQHNNKKLFRADGRHIIIVFQLTLIIYKLRSLTQSQSVHQFPILHFPFPTSNHYLKVSWQAISSQLVLRSITHLQSHKVQYPISHFPSPIIIFKPPGRCNLLSTISARAWLSRALSQIALKFNSDSGSYVTTRSVLETFLLDLQAI